MKKLSVLALAAAVAGGFSSTAAVAGVSANLGYASEYYFRGVLQSESSASAGVDYEHDSGIYAGVWGADVGGHGDASQSAGIEVDVYAGYAGEVSGFSYSLGFTNYQYTGDFDTDYQEVNLGFGYGPVSVEFSSGTHEAGATDEDYTFAAVTYEYESLSATYGTWGDDFAGSYFELALSKEFAELDFGVSLLNGDADENDPGNVASDGTALIFTIGKTFDL